jgi:hypothetical protein
VTIRIRKRPKLSAGLKRRREHNISVLKKRLPGTYNDHDFAIFPDRFLGKLANFVNQEALRGKYPEYYEKKGKKRKGE